MEMENAIRKGTSEQNASQNGSFYLRLECHQANHTLPYRRPRDRILAIVSPLRHCRRAVGSRWGDLGFVVLASDASSPQLCAGLPSQGTSEGGGGAAALTTRSATPCVATAT